MARSSGDQLQPIPEEVESAPDKMPVQEISVKTLDELLQASAATPGFKAAAKNLSAGMKQDIIRYNAGSPPVKVLRLVSKLLESFPEVPFSGIEVKGESGCSEFVGHATAEPGSMQFEFEWNCSWRAQERGWTDAFGDPDQIRAARTLGYQCFRRLEIVNGA